MHYLSFEDMCQKKGLDPVSLLPDVSKCPAKHQAAIVATTKLFLLADEVNEDWVPDWDNDDQYKWYPWFDLEKHKKNNPTGFQFFVAFYFYSTSYVGSRLCFRSREDAKFAGETYLDLYRTMMVIE